MWVKFEEISSFLLLLYIQSVIPINVDISFKQTAELCIIIMWNVTKRYFEWKQKDLIIAMCNSENNDYMQ